MSCGATIAPDGVSPRPNSCDCRSSDWMIPRSELGAAWTGRRQTVDPRISSGFRHRFPVVRRRNSYRAWPRREVIRDSLEPGASAAIIVYEESWARGVASAVRKAGGEVALHVQVPRDAVDAAVAAAASAD